MNRFLCQLPVQVIFILLGVVPLFWMPSFFSLFEGAKVGLFTLLVDVAFAGLVLYLPPPASSYRKIQILLAGFVIVSFITTLLNGTLAVSFWGNPYRSDGLWTLIHLALFAVLVSRYVPYTRVFLKAACVPYSALTVWAVLAHFFPAFDLPSARWSDGVALTLGNPNMLSGYLSVGSPLLFHMWRTARSRHMRICAAALFTCVLYLSFVNSSWGALLTLAAAVFLLTLRTRRAAAVTAGILLAAFGVTCILFYGQEMIRRTQPTGVPVTESRERIYTKAVIAIAHKPFLGWGWANYSHVFQTIDWPIRYNEDAAVDRTHSSFLDVGVYTGLLGLGIFLFLAYTAAWSLWKSRSHTSYVFFMILILYLIHSQTNITSIAEDILFYWAIGASINTSGKMS